MEDSQARIALGQALQNLERIVAGAVVDSYYLDILEGLRKNGVDGCFKEGGGVIYRYQDRYSAVLRHTLSCLVQVEG